jgi:hypothetical protein
MAENYKVTFSCNVEAENEPEAMVKALHMMNDRKNWGTTVTVTQEEIPDEGIAFEV